MDLLWQEACLNMCFETVTYKSNRFYKQLFKTSVICLIIQLQISMSLPWYKVMTKETRAQSFYVTEDGHMINTLLPSLLKRAISYQNQKVLPYN